MPKTHYPESAQLTARELDNEVVETAASVRLLANWFSNINSHEEARRLATIADEIDRMAIPW
jgi:hypothetical protein